MSRHMTATIISASWNMPDPKHKQNTVIKYIGRKPINETQLKHYFEKLSETTRHQYILEFN